MPKFFKEPLFHFLLFGVLIFILYAFVNQAETSENDIVIDDARIEHLSALYKLQYKREASNPELAKLIESNIKQEIFYREALRLHLDENDDVVKSRLAQKMEFLNTDLTALDSKPSEAELETYYQNNKENYKTQARFSFYQIAFSAKNHSDTKSAAEKVLANANTMPVENMRAQGDKLALSFAYTDLTAEAVGFELGETIATKLTELPLKKWVGPFKSKYGEHLIFVTEYQKPAIPAAQSIVSRLTNDYASAKERDVQDAMYKELKSQYNIRLESEVVNDEMKAIILKSEQ